MRRDLSTDKTVSEIQELLVHEHPAIDVHCLRGGPGRVRIESS
ncbi:hypothetical protein [Natrinema sp. SYSU A 869]|nr:hypothetical protein [Natrinema sp. SYSU A 869]